MSETVIWRAQSLDGKAKLGSFTGYYLSIWSIYSSFVSASCMILHSAKWIQISQDMVIFDATSHVWASCLPWFTCGQLFCDSLMNRACFHYAFMRCVSDRPFAIHTKSSCTNYNTYHYTKTAGEDLFGPRASPRNTGDWQYLSEYCACRRRCT